MPAPSWVGFSQLVTDSQSNVFHVSDVVALPFISLNPSDIRTICMVLEFVQSEASRFNRSYYIVTFCQPLLMKAVGTVHPSADMCDSVITQVGGLHLIFSYMGADGYILSGSGQEQMWRTAYAEGSTPQIVSWQPYSPALCAHILSIRMTASVLLTSTDGLDHINTQVLHHIRDDLLHENISFENALSACEVS